MSDRTLLVRVTGHVQGVGFRAFTAAQATRCGVTGWVRNRDDGSVEALLHGPGGALGELVGALRDGPPSARVVALDVQSADRGAAAEPPSGALAF